jgi:cyclin-A
MVIRMQNRTLEHYTSYRSADIQACVYALRELQHNTSNCTLNAIREKYSQEKVCPVSGCSSLSLLLPVTLTVLPSLLFFRQFECVANLTSPEPVQSLFS